MPGVCHKSAECINKSCKIVLVGMIYPIMLPKGNIFFLESANFFRTGNLFCPCDVFF